MAEEKRYLDYPGLEYYNDKLHQEIEKKDTATLDSAKEYVDQHVLSWGKLGQS